MQSTPVTITTLTPLRGMAAVLVAVYHFAYAFIINPSPFLSRCYIMVDLFFIMSGFIMLHVYQSTFKDHLDKNQVQKFLIARFARIYPLHLAILLLFVGMIFLSGHASQHNPIYPPSAIITNIFLLQSFGFHSTGTWNVASWSISAEWWAYMLFPFLCYFIFNKRVIGLFIFLLSILFIYLLIVYYLPRHDQNLDFSNIDVSYDYGFLRGIAGFISGMVVYLLYRSKTVYTLFKNDWFAVIPFAIMLYLLQIRINDLYFIPVFMLLVLALSCNSGVICKISNNKILQFIGEISYSIYLTHGLVILLLIQLLMHTKFGYKGPVITNYLIGIAFIIPFLLLIIGVSTLTYNFIEKPCRDWINNKYKSRKKILKQTV